MTGPLGSSNVGGHFGAELRAAAVQTLLIQGRAPRPVTLWFDGDRVELRDTTHLWGLDTRAAESLQGDLAGDCGLGSFCLETSGPGSHARHPAAWEPPLLGFPDKN